MEMEKIEKADDISISFRLNAGRTLGGIEAGRGREGVDRGEGHAGGTRLEPLMRLKTTENSVCREAIQRSYSVSSHNRRPSRLPGPPQLSSAGTRAGRAGRGGGQCRPLYPP